MQTKIPVLKMTIRGLILTGILLFNFLAGFAQYQKLNIIPKPLYSEIGKGRFTFSPDVVLAIDPGASKVNTEGFQAHFKSISGYKLKVSFAKKDSKNSIHLRIDSTTIQHPEGYILQVKPGSIEVVGADLSGLFYGLQTLSQVLEKSKNGKIESPVCRIEDYPRFSYRGMHLDVGRHYFPMASLKKWLDVLAFYKINTFHWHLTDDQGWRIEIKKYPELQNKAAWRNETLIGHKRAEPHLFDGKRYGGYYTQEEVKALVRYAQERQITIIPEIEMPGHAQAVLAAYPNLGCTGGPYQTATNWGVFEDVFCAGNEQTFNFLEGVLDEVITLFPSSYIHIGGDECPKTRWKACPKCQARIQQEGLKDEHQLQSYFMERIEKYLSKKGKKIIGWDEILEGGLTPDATVMSWRGIEGGIAAAKLKHDVIMTPERFVYLDYYQSLNESEQIAAGGYTPLKKLYEYEPLPQELSAEEQHYIKGVQANVWSEYLSSASKAEYVMFPRVIGLAEMGWSSPENRKYTDFLSRLRVHRQYLKGLNSFKGFDEVRAELSNPSPGIHLKTDAPNSVIRYTLNGNTPSGKDPIYKKELLPATSAWVKATTFTGNKADSRVYTQYFSNSMALGKSVKLKHKPQGNYAPDPQVMVNGISGTKLYNNGEWLGFSGDNLEVVVDLGESKSVSEIGINILKYHWQKMWAPQVLSFEISENGEKYTPIYSQKDFPLEGINVVNHKFKAVKGRFVKITGINVGTIPEGAYGAGGKAWLLADEITIN